MAVTCVIGVQWGDEGKGKVVDLLARRSDFVVRFQGGGNAGHTVVVGREKYVLHLIPSGVLHPGVRCVIGNGVVVDPAQFFQEIADLRARGIAIDGGNLHVSERAHLVLPYHKLQDRLAESSRSREKLGTTGRGIGPCYMDKAARVGLRVADLLNPPRFADRLRANVEEKNKLFTAVYGGEALDAAAVLAEYEGHRERMRPFVCDTARLLQEASEAGKELLLEGAQGTLLDVDFGTYPFVTSSHSDAGGVAAGCGLPARRVDRVVGVLKAYTTRVGSGPCPTELKDAQGVDLREKGEEYGATTGRPRRCGWFDLVACRYSVRLNDVDVLAVTKLDVLDHLETLRVAVAYEVRGERTDHFPADVDALEEARPVYRDFAGWRRPIGGIRRRVDLPAAARAYLDFLEESLETPIQLVSVGSERDQTIVEGLPWISGSSGA
ncbi:MAG: adenylosuccinate synthase [Planctomycetes bacterium]|nr:adenylosuccinate synthase [Planctomycetota bacterium]